MDDKHSEEDGEGVKVPGNYVGKSALTLFFQLTSDGKHVCAKMIYIDVH